MSASLLRARRAEGLGLSAAAALLAAALLSACGSATLDADLGGVSASASLAAPSPPPPASAPPPATVQVAENPNADAVLEGDRIRIARTIHYEVDKDEIRAESLPILDAVATILMSHPEIVEVIVEGHTDDQGSFDHNRRLSERRANAVVRYLALKGVRQPMQAPGYGATAPICRTNDEGCRATNRRVEFKVKRRS